MRRWIIICLLVLLVFGGCEVVESPPSSSVEPGDSIFERYTIDIDADGVEEELVYGIFGEDRPENYLFRVYRGGELLSEYNILPIGHAFSLWLTRDAEGNIYLHEYQYHLFDYGDDGRRGSMYDADYVMGADGLILAGEDLRWSDGIEGPIMPIAEKFPEQEYNLQPAIETTAIVVFYE